MTTGLVLIAAILILGGVIATVGDRLGTRVGKARLTLFNLRPRKTATLITILTGGVIAASTLGILFAVSDNLRTGVFDLERIRRESRLAAEDRDKAKAEREQIERRLESSRRRQEAAKRRLATINEYLKAANERQARTAEQLNRSQAQLGAVQSKFQQAQDRFQQAQSFLQTVSGQLNTLRSELQQLQAGRQELIQQRDQVKAQIAQRDEEIRARDERISERDRAIAERESQLLALESQRSDLEKEVQDLQGIRDGSVTIFRNQVLASSPPFKVVDPEAAPQLINLVLLQANRVAIQRIRPDTPHLDRQIISIPNAEVEPLVKQIQDGREYVVRILSARNYAIGQPCVLAGDACIEVRAVAILNQLVFPRGGIIAASTIDPAATNQDELIDLILRLISAAQFRARQASILADRVVVANNRTERVSDFLKKVEEYNQPLEIQVVAAEDAYTAGITRLELVAVQNGQVLFSTQ
jgi:uncharacterized protein (DUF3084 family)